ncbi:MAG: Gfo/Idh/MocA family oxidoreductase [Prolixibacteraceae bacterium]|nr:Gfo/Idh/MocA family oxidoreductase [Prolixibacteraceae bacterium]
MNNLTGKYSSKQTSSANNFTRRQFVEKTLLGSAGIIGGSVGLLAQPVISNRPVSANDKIILGVMGLGGRNCFLIEEFLKQGAEVAWICDVDTRRFENGLRACRGDSWESRTPQDFRWTGDSPGQKRVPKTTQDFRRILDDKEVNAMLIAPGTHWSPLGTIMACQAGKDVYVEKPMSSNVYEGRKMVEAARKYNKIVQVGSQNRSGLYHKKAIEYLKAGNIGKVHYIRVLNMLNGRLGSPGPYPEMEIPREVDYDMWCGPAPKRPYNTKKTASGVWRYFWEYSGSDSESIHQVDVARWVATELSGHEYPDSVYSKGSVRYPDRVADIPDSIQALFDYGDITLSMEIDWWTSLVKVPQDIRWSETEYPEWQFLGTRIEIYGTEGMMYLGRHGGGWQAFGKDGSLKDQMKGVMPIKEHIANFLNCVKSRELPNADVERAHISQAISHIAYISYRVGNQLLKIDGNTEMFAGNSEANALLSRPDGGRSPWKIPDKV